ncbi:MAG: helix-turn-helix domain-containing protein [SAR324 cluster bacterium]|uniref:Helix-turn-helix domain-containing protein n=1 Tax=SAR324 cluster bacterium TaxID=2024889 RepID=A0A7X9IJ41_9DELT|nr:helix-turn-helix domain-containing protein [SAR324 cluster bacterium]
MTPHDWLTVEGCAAYLSITPRAVYCLVDRGRLPAHRLGRKLYFLRSEIDQLLKASVSCEVDCA